MAESIKERLDAAKRLILDVGVELQKTDSAPPSASKCDADSLYAWADDLKIAAKKLESIAEEKDDANFG